MKKALTGLFSILSLKNKHLSLTFITVLLFFCATAQYDSTKVLQDQNAYGFSWKNSKFRGSLIIPNDTPHLAQKDSGAVAYKGAKSWSWNGYFWITNSSNISQAYDSTSLNWDGTKYIYWSEEVAVDSISISASPNFANTDLTATGRRVHNFNGYSLLIANSTGMEFNSHEPGISTHNSAWGISPGQWSFSSRSPLFNGTTAIQGYDTTILMHAGELAGNTHQINITPTGVEIIRDIDPSTFANFKIHTDNSGPVDLNHVAFFDNDVLKNGVISVTETDPSSVHITDTAAMLLPYLRGVTAAATYQPIGSYATIAQNALKVNISDTAAMLSNYLTGINANTAAIAGKQNTITTGTTGQYFRGDLSLATFPTIPAQFNPIAGTNLTLSGTYPNITFNATAGGAGTVTGGSITWPGTIYSTPTTGTVSSGLLTFAPSLASQSAYTLFGRGSGSGTPSFLASIDSNWIPGLHTEGYYNTKYSTGGGGGSQWTTTGSDIYYSTGKVGIGAAPLTDFYGRFATNGTFRMGSASGTGKVKFEMTESETGAPGSYGAYIQYNGAADAASIGGINGGTSVDIMSWGYAANEVLFYKPVLNSSYFSATGSGNRNSFLTFNGGTSSNSGIGTGSMNNADLAIFVYSGEPLMFGNGTDGTNTTTSNASMWISGTKNLVMGTSTNDASAKLNVFSVTQGALLPRMTTAQRNAIASPATGLELYCSDCTAIDASTGVKQCYNGSTWKSYW